LFGSKKVRGCKNGTVLLYHHANYGGDCIKFDADMFIQSGIIDMFPKLKMAAVGFSGYMNLAIPTC